MLNQNPKDMTLILLRFFLKKIQLKCNNCSYYFLILVFMLASKSTTSQVVSDFTTTNSNTGCGSLVVEFEDLSTGNPNSWLWDFGNGITSTQQNPVVVYANEGFYSVSLSISDAVTSGVMENRVYMYHVYVTDYNEKVWVYNGELNLMK